MSTEETLNDLKLWMQRHLENTHARNNSTGYGQKKGDGFAVVEIPDWEMRQKLGRRGAEERGHSRAVP